jgi:AraC-like DNA-binding protein
MNPDHEYVSIGINPSPGDGELSVLFSGEGRPVSGHGIGPAIHDYYLIHTVLSGKGEFVIRDKRYICGEGDTFIIFPGELFSYRADEVRPWQYVWVSIIGHGVDNVMGTLGAAPDQPVIENGLNPEVRRLYRQLHDCFQSPDSPELTNLEADGLVRLLLQQLAVANRRSTDVKAGTDSAIDRLVKQAVQFLTLQYTQPISIEQMSGMLGYHRTHLCKLFKHATGFSPMQYLLKIRMERAERLLASSMTIDQIASSVGFNDALYFSRKFRKWRGQSPSEYRKALRESRSADA